MELMEKTLTQFLEEAEHDIPVHLQVNLCLDITFALAYLHSQQIVHGHLTSNNVLLIGTIAKVAEFGISKLLDSHSSVMQPALYLPPDVRVTHPEFSEKSDMLSLGALVVQIVTRETPTPTPQQQPVPLSEVDRRQQHIQKIASTHPLQDIALLCLKDTAVECPTAKNVLTKLTAVKYHPQYEDSLKKEREMAQEGVVQLLKELKSKEEQIQQNQESQKQLGMAQQEVAQLKENLKSKEEQILRQKESEKQLGMAQQEVAQLKEKLKSEKESVLKLEQESQEQLKYKDQKIRDAELQQQALQLVLENESERVRGLKNELEETKEKLQNESEKVRGLKNELEETKEKLQNESEKVQERDKQIQAHEMKVKKLLQQNQKKDVKVSELKSTMDKIASLVSVARQ